MAARKSTASPPLRSETELRALILRYFYDRNASATSEFGKRGSAVRTSDVKKELKALHGLSQQEVQRNLTYLISQRWIEDKEVSKSFTPGGGRTVVNSVTRFYKITAQGMDKIEGPGEFTPDRLHGIRIEATGQNIITVGDGNRVNASFGDVGEALAELRDAVTASDVSEMEKLTCVADIESIQSQLAKPAPSRPILRAAWEGVKAGAAVNDFSNLVERIGGLIAPLL